MEETYNCKLYYLVCKNPACTKRYQTTKQGKKQLRVYRPTTFAQFAVPRRQLTWALLNEIGYLRFGMRLDVESVQKLLTINYALEVPTSTLVEWCDLYEAACLAWHIKYPAQVREKLNQLPEVVYLIDFTEDTTKDPVLRIFVAGLGLNLLSQVVPNADTEATLKILKKLDRLYRAPGLIVCDDDKTIKEACAKVWPTTPIQECFEHLFRRITKKLLEPPRKQAHAVLQQYAYQKQLKKLLTTLELKTKDPWPEHGEDLRQLIKFLLYKPPGGDHTQPRPLQKLQDFEATWTHLNYLFKAIQGQKLPPDTMSPELQALYELKKQLPPAQKFQGLTDNRLLKDSFYQALRQVKRLVDLIHADPRTREALDAWQLVQTELKRLQGWLWALKLHRFKRNRNLHSEDLTTDQQRAFNRLRGLFQTLTAHQKRELQRLTGPSPTVPTAAAAFLQKLITHWRALGQDFAPFQVASRQLSKAAPNLLHFLAFQWAPPSQQELEGQNNRLKQVFRQQSGHVASRHRLVYHAEGYSAVLNFHSKIGALSPLNRLGIDLGPDPQWLSQLSWTDLHHARLKLRALRQPRRTYLVIRKEGLPTIRLKSQQKWSHWVYQQLQQESTAPQLRSII